MDIQKAAKDRSLSRSDVIITEKLKSIQIQQLGLEILLILITSQCIMIISGMMLMEIIQ